MQSDSVNSTKILSLLFAFGRRMRDDGKKHEKPSPYSMLHFQTLRYVGEEGKPFMHDVAGYLCVTPPAATLLIDGLVKDKLLTRSFDKKDRRAVRVMLTGRGKRFLTRGIREKMTKLKSAFAALTPKERSQFAVLLEKLLLRP